MAQYYGNILHKLLDSSLLPMTTRHYSTIFDAILVHSRTVLDIFFTDLFSSEDDLWGEIFISVMYSGPV